MQAITAVGNILQFYNHDKQIALYGFGGKVPPKKSISHCFALNGDIFNPRVDGVEEVLRYYQNAVRNVELAGPTNFSEIIFEINNQIFH